MSRLGNTNMEKFYGFRINVDDAVDPLSEQAVRLKLNQTFNQISLSNYLIYFHNLIIKAENEHFGFEGLSSRAIEINVLFQVNPKQIKSGKIKFLNYFFQNTNEANIVHPYSTNSMVGFDIKSKHFDEDPHFGTVLVTFIDKDLKLEHRKIKLSVSARPTTEYRIVASAENLLRVTNADLKYRKAVQLRLPMGGLDRKESIMKTPDKSDATQTINFLGPIGVVNANKDGKIYSNSDISNMNQNTYFQLETELRMLSNYLKSNGLTDDLVIGKVEDAIVHAGNNDKKRLSQVASSVGGKVGKYAGDIGAKLLEAYLKLQMGL